MHSYNSSGEVGCQRHCFKPCSSTHTPRPHLHMHSYNISGEVGCQRHCFKPCSSTHTPRPHPQMHSNSMPTKRCSNLRHSVSNRSCIHTAVPTNACRSYVWTRANNRLKSLEKHVGLARTIYMWSLYARVSKISSNIRSNTAYIHGSGQPLESPMR